MAVIKHLSVTTREAVHMLNALTSQKASLLAKMKRNFDKIDTLSRAPIFPAVKPEHEKQCIRSRELLVSLYEQHNRHLAEDVDCLQWLINRLCEVSSSEQCSAN